MKLRNKKTGEIINIDIIENRKDGSWEWQGSKTLHDLNKEWEDYEPKEPLIKDEKIRKAVRAWAEANELKPSAAVDYSCVCYKFEGSYCSIDFNIPVGALESDIYTFAELCGEEE